MHTAPAEEEASLPAKVRELDIQPALRIRSFLRTSRFLLLCGSTVAVIVVLSTSTEWQRLSIIIALIAGILLPAGLHTVVFKASRLLALCETFVLAVFLALIVFVAVQVGIRVSHNIESIALGLALIVCALAAYCLYRAMYPTVTDPLEAEQSFTRLFTHEKSGRRQGHIWPILIAVGFVGIALALVPEGMGEDFGWLLAGMLTCYFLAVVVVPIAWLLRRTRVLQPLKAVAKKRKVQPNSNYFLYLLAHGRDRGSALRYAFYALLWLSTDCILLSRLVNPWSFLVRLLTSIPMLNSPVFLTFIFAMILAQGHSNYRKGLATLARSVDQLESAQLAEAGGFTLYLRSFEDDDFQFDLAAKGWRRLVYLQHSLYQHLFRSIRIEELIVRTLWPYRPVLSVASPEVESASVGALHLHLPTATWQADVLQLAQKASSILMVMAGTPGVKWEFQELATRSDLRGKLILVLPPETPYEAQTRWRALFGGSIEARGIAPESVARTLAIRLESDGSMEVITSDDRSAAAYRLALHLCQLPSRENCYEFVSRSSGSVI